jgi:hypothetical protein
MITPHPLGDFVVTTVDLGFPIWVRLSHWFNFLFVTMLVRSGLEILSAHPKLPMNSPAWCALWGDRADAVSGSSLGRCRQSP